MTTQTKAAVGSGGQRQNFRAADSIPQPHSITGQVYAQGRVVGQVRGNVFHKTVRGSVHMLRRPPAWALDLGSLLQAEKQGARSVEIRDIETGNRYRASIEQVRRHGFTLDRGYGQQIGLALDRWTLTRPGEVQAEQLNLFGVTP